MKVILCADLTEKSLQELDQFTGTPYFQAATEIDVVHAFETKIYTAEFYASYFPTKDQYPEIEKTVTALLKSALDKKLNPSNNKKINYRCLFSTTPKESLVDLAHDRKADLLVIATRAVTGVKSIFQSSFAHFMVGHAHCPVLILK